MLPARPLVLLAFSALLADQNSATNCASPLRQMVGWTVLKVATVNGTFEGCDYNRLIELDDGTILRCNSYGYQYAYMPDAILFGKSVNLNGQSVFILRLLVEDEVYDMLSVNARK